MKKHFVVTAIFTALASGCAVAADLPTKAGPAPVMARPACAQFGGVYVGGNVGWAFYQNRWSDRDAWTSELSDDLQRSNVSSTDNGFIGGVQAGYNWQRGCTVFGVEADYAWGSVKNSSLETDSDTGIDVDSLTINSRLRGFGTLRGRTGIIVDDVLLYVTGGFAYGNFKRSYTQSDLNTPGSETFSDSKNKWGWTAGFGAEWAINNNWSLKSEVLYAQFEKDDSAFICSATITCGPPGEPKRFTNEDSVWVTRIGLNYRWGGIR